MGAGSFNPIFSTLLEELTKEALVQLLPFQIMCVWLVNRLRAAGLMPSDEFTLVKSKETELRKKVTWLSLLFFF
jgi:hypothetical protein